MVYSPRITAPNNPNNKQRTTQTLPLSYLAKYIRLQSPSGYFTTELDDQIHGIFDNCTFINSRQPPHINTSNTSSTYQEKPKSSKQYSLDSDNSQYFASISDNNDDHFFHNDNLDK